MGVRKAELPVLTEHAVHRFLVSLRRAFARADQRSGDVELRHFRIGGFPLQVRCASPAMAPLLRAFEHLKSGDNDGPGLRLYLADTASTGVSPPVVPRADRPMPGDSWRLRGSAGDVLCYYAEGVTGVVDHAQGTAVFWAEDAARLPQYMHGSPFLRLLHWWFASQGRQIVHAAAVGQVNGGVLLTGPGGAGKSTAAFACLDSRLGYTGDDYCLVNADGPPRAFSLYSSGKLHLHNVARFPGLVPDPRWPGDEKALFFIRDLFPEKVLPSFPIRAVLLPHVSGQRDTVLRPASRAEAFLAAAQSTLCQLIGEEAHSYQNIGRLFRELPCYTLETGTDLEQIPQVILGLLAES
ncbi:MAG: serine kinase [Candidatus Hydrogenedentes bacterium]|nr:serine kinase [Candidatus Hydrogenedentota bacterium]